MKKLSLITGIFALLFIASCRDVVNTVLDILPPFDVNFTTNMNVPFATVDTNSYTRTPEIPMNIDLDSEIKKNDPNYSINNLKSVKLNTLTIDYLGSQLGNKLDAIKNARIYVVAPNQPEKLIATAYNNTNPNTITFTTTDEEILQYFRTKQNSLVIEIQGSYVTADQIEMKMNSSFKIRVQL